MEMHKIMTNRLKQLKEQKENEIQEIPLLSLKENPYQPRIKIKSDEIKNLANSIKEKGLLQPILIAKADTGYYIVAGHRRVEAHKWLGKDKIKARVIKVNNEDLVSLALIENIQREDLDLIETAMALKRYKEEFRKTDEEIAKEIGKSRSTVTQILNVLNLPNEIIKDVKDNKSTKDVLALNMLNSYFKKLTKNVNMLTKSTNLQEIEVESELEKRKNEIIELYQEFLKYGRGWLKEEIDKRLKLANRQKSPEIKMEVGKRKTKIEINVPLTKDALNKLKSLIKELAQELGIDEIKIKDHKKLKHTKTKKSEKEKEEVEKKEYDTKKSLEEIRKFNEELENMLKR